MPALETQAQESNTQKIDSLRSLLVRKVGIEKCELLYQLAYEYFEVDNALSLEFSAHPFKEALKIGDSLLFVKAGRIRASAFERLEQVDSSIAVSIQILPIALHNGYSRELKYILNTLGVTYVLKAQYDKALSYHFRSLNLREKFEDDYAVSIALNNIGMVFYKIKGYRMALSYFERALKLRSSAQNA